MDGIVCTGSRLSHACYLEGLWVGGDGGKEEEEECAPSVWG